MQKITQLQAMPGLIGPRLWTQTAIALLPSRAMYVAAVDAAGPGR